MQTEWNYGVTGFEAGMDECPLFTNYTRTWFGAKLVERRFRKQGLLTKIYNLKESPAPGLNPRKEPKL